MEFVIYTDLDGTLLDHDTYSYGEATPALNEVKKKNIPLIICSSKTRAEIEVYRKKLDLRDPFISENGGAVFIPPNYFPGRAGAEEMKDYEVIEFGRRYSELRKALCELRNKAGCRITGFGDMTPEEVSVDCGITTKEAVLAKKREYDEAFKMECSDEEKQKIFELIRETGLHHTKGGRYYHLMGENDKGKAVNTLTSLYRKNHPKVRTIGLGDSGNDYPMLKNVDVPVLIRRPEGYAGFKKQGLIRSRLVGPTGWNKEILKLI